ncbi:MAG: cation-transporting P-type ATPase [Chloroflexi bacterium]|nr:cation-transporting P-type ATPase [Chloroflexota bacterium]
MESKQKPLTPAPAWHTLGALETAAELEVDPEIGLDPSQARERLAHFGSNQVQVEKQEPIWKEFLEELAEPMILLLLATAGLYAISGEIADAIAILLIILALNTIEVVNEQRAKRAIMSLRKLGAPTALVQRQGAAVEIPGASVVPGDILLLQAGHRLAADARLLESYSLNADESTLTGESTPVEKNAQITLLEETPLSERANVMYAGTLVTRGRGKGVVVATGGNTELGRLAQLTQTLQEPRTPLQKAMRELSGWMIWIAIGFSILIPFLGVVIGGYPIQEMLLIGFSLAFATIPEEMPIIITMVLGLGAYRLSQSQAIVKHLQAVETLGAVTVIATDKTGTLTENRMAVREFFPPENRSVLLTIGVVANGLPGSHGEPHGDPLEAALSKAARQEGINPDYPLLNEFTFDNERKRMSVVCRWSPGMWVAVKGAPEAILDVSGSQLTTNGDIPLTNEARQVWLERASSMAAQGLRVIAAAEKWLPDRSPITQLEAESGLVLVGLIGIADPPRPEAAESIQACRRGGIRTMMITGDHPLTARSVADQVGMGDGSAVLTGAELDRISDEDLPRVIANISIFARTTPEHKLRIVRLLQAQGERVAVTGDGTNDAPALAAADIGVAMGATGSDVAREAGDIILADDNFATIVRAIREGRTLYENLRKGVRYYLACKVALVLIMLLAVLVHAPVPFTPIQIILMELFMDLAAAASFVAEPGEGDLMSRPPRNPRQPFMDHEMIVGILMGAAGLFAAVSTAYLIAWHSGMQTDAVHTVAFVSWLIGHVLLAFNMRSARRSVFSLGFFSNRFMNAWGAAVILFVLFVTASTPLQVYVQTAPLDLPTWLIILACTITGTFWLEINKGRLKIS